MKSIGAILILFWCTSLRVDGYVHTTFSSIDDIQINNEGDTANRNYYASNAGFHYTFEKQPGNSDTNLVNPDAIELEEQSVTSNSTLVDSEVLELKEQRDSSDSNLFNSFSNTKGYLTNQDIRTLDHTCGTPDFTLVSTCKEETGVLSFIPNSEEITFKFDRAVLGEDTLVQLILNSTDYNQLDTTDDCIVTFTSSEVFIKTDEESDLIKDSNYYYVGTDVVVRLAREDSKTCFITILYTAAKPVYESWVLDEPTGEITLTPEPDLALGYPNLLRRNWNFDFSENYIIEFQVNMLDLGDRGAPLHWEQSRSNNTFNDFILIGIETESGIQGTSYLFYGTSNESKSVQVNSPDAFVAFYGSYHEQYATGFNITYKAIQIELPTVPTTESTTTELYIGVSPTSVASINGVLMHNLTVSQTEMGFRQAVAEMATAYILKEDIIVENNQSVSSADVDVLECTTCIQTYCQPDCLSFKFTITKHNYKGDAYAFTDDDLYAIVRQEDQQMYWRQYLTQTSEFCEEMLVIPWIGIGLGCIVVVLCLVIVLLVVWKISDTKKSLKSQETVKDEQMIEKLERRRRSSGEASNIGTKRGRTRISLPFTALRESVSTIGSSIQEEDYDTTGFKEFDTDIGYEDYGFSTSVSGEATSSKFYSNPAFEPDSPTQRRRMQYFEELQRKAADEEEEDDLYNRNRSAAIGDVVEILGPSTSKTHEPNLKSVPLKSSLKKTNSGNEDIQEVKLKMTTFSEVEEEHGDSDDSDGALQFQKVSPS